MKNLLSIIFLLVYTIAFSQNESNIQRKIDAIFSAYSLKTPGVAVAVVQGDKVVFKNGYGMANLEYDIPITPKTIFHVASVSKQFTAFSIYLLAEQGKITLEDDIRKYFPELPDYGKTIKVKHLLAHTSGLRDQWALLTLAGWRMDDVITTEQILRLLGNQNALNFEPGTQFMYSNSGYTLLAEMIHRVTGKSFAEFTKEHIFQPLGMNDSQFCDDHQKIVKNRAYSYEYLNKQYINKKLNYSTVGATSLLTTVEDLAKWIINFNKPKIGNPSLISAFDEISILDNGKPVIWAASPGDTTYHAKGQLHYYHRGVKVISHGGHDAGFRATLTRFPNNNLAVIALSNDEHYNTFGSLMNIAEVYLENDFKENQPSSATRNQQDNTVDYTPESKPFLGVYTSDELSTVYEIKEINGKLNLIHPRLDNTELTQVGVDMFEGINSFPIQIFFIRINGAVKGFSISNFGAKNVEFLKTGAKKKQLLRH